MSFDDVARRMAERAGSAIPASDEPMSQAVEEGTQAARTRNALFGILLISAGLVWFCVLGTGFVATGLVTNLSCFSLVIFGILRLARGPGSRIDRMARR
jgi:hypothetical protein